MFQYTFRPEFTYTFVSYGKQCFGLSPALKVFTKLIAIIRRLNIIITIYLDDMLILVNSREEVIQSRDTYSDFLASTFRFSDKREKVCPVTQVIFFLDLQVNSRSVTLSSINRLRFL